MSEVIDVVLKMNENNVVTMHGVAEAQTKSYWDFPPFIKRELHIHRTVVVKYNMETGEIVGLVNGPTPNPQPISQ